MLGLFNGVLLDYLDKKEGKVEIMSFPLLKSLRVCSNSYGLSYTYFKVLILLHIIIINMFTLILD
jgi:hypothetical protein